LNDIVTIEHDRPPAEMFHQTRALAPATNVGAVAIEQERAIAEAQGKLILAKRFPRSVAAATAEFLDACKSPEFAAKAFYAVPNRGSGPSIRFAEEAARCYGNFEFGHRELSRSDGKSEIEVYAWDVEKNNFSRRQITVMHVLDSKTGSRVLRDQADIDNKIANVASKQMRGRILAILPKGMIAAGEMIAKQTIAGGSEKPVSQRITDMTVHFSKYGVTAEMLEKHLGHKLDATTVDELADLAGIFNAIREGGKASEFFGLKEDPATDPPAAATKIAAAARAGEKKAAEPKPAEPKAEPAKAAAPVQAKPPEPEAQPAVTQEPATSEEAPAASADEESVF
jgi:hypothetical protein